MSHTLTARRVRRARRVVGQNRCPGARNPGVMHLWEYAYYSLIGEAHECLRCGRAE